MIIIGIKKTMCTIYISYLSMSVYIYLYGLVYASALNDFVSASPSCMKRISMKGANVKGFHTLFQCTVIFHFLCHNIQSCCFFLRKIWLTEFLSVSWGFISLIFKHFTSSSTSLLLRFDLLSYFIYIIIWVRLILLPRILHIYIYHSYSSYVVACSSRDSSHTRDYIAYACMLRSHFACFVGFNCWLFKLK